MYNPRMNEHPTAACLMGPTASGKTALAIELVKTGHFEIVSVDSAMVYRGMDIGTAKPSEVELQQAPHRLIDIRDPADPYSAGDFRTDAIDAINDILSNGKTPLLVGGTMLYFHVLQQGIAALPQADPDIRAALLKEADTIGWPAMHKKLEKIDPAAAARIHQNDTQRIQRALELFHVTQKPASELQKIQAQNALPYAFRNLKLLPERALVHQRIEQRFHQMINAGLVDEVKKLYERGDLTADSPAMRCVGYRQVWKYLDGEYDHETMLFKGIVATRQLAKRQYTWLRRFEGKERLGNEQNPLEEILKYYLNS